MCNVSKITFAYNVKLQFIYFSNFFVLKKYIYKYAAWKFQIDLFETLMFLFRTKLVPLLAGAFKNHRNRFYRTAFHYRRRRGG